MNLLFTKVWHWNKGKNRTVPGGDCLEQKREYSTFNDGSSDLGKADGGVRRPGRARSRVDRHFPQHSSKDLVYVARRLSCSG